MFPSCPEKRSVSLMVFLLQSLTRGLIWQHTQGAAGCRVCGGVGLAHRALGFPWALLQDCWVRHQACGRTSCPSPEHLSRNCVPSVPFDVLTCLFPGALPPRGHGGPPLVLGCCRVKWVPLTAGVRGHSLATLLTLLG